jgi:hypothetical protein
MGEGEGEKVIPPAQKISRFLRNSWSSTAIHVLNIVQKSIRMSSLLAVVTTRHTQFFVSQTPTVMVFLNNLRRLGTE